MRKIEKNNFTARKDVNSRKLFKEFMLTFDAIVGSNYDHKCQLEYEARIESIICNANKM